MANLRRAGLAVMMACWLAGCGGDDNPAPFSDCHIGELSGTWRTHYAETNGNCGAIADETGIFNPNAPPPAGVTIDAKQISSDKCRGDLAFTIATTDGQGSQSWVMVIHQTSATELQGTATLQLNHPTLGNCRSTYDVTVTQL
jgi:hypothetical protein